MRIKGRYVALVEIDFNFQHEKEMLPFEKIKENFSDGKLTDDIKELIYSEIMDRYGDVKVTQQYADMYEVEDDQT